MPIYVYENKKTGEILEELRSYADSDKPFVTPDGTVCERVITTLGCVVDKNCEPFKKDPDYVKRLNPKYIKFNDGHRERYDPTRHC